MPSGRAGPVRARLGPLVRRALVPGDAWGAGTAGNRLDLGQRRAIKAVFGVKGARDERQCGQLARIR